MGIEIVTDFRVLLQLARAVAQAEKAGDKDAIATAKASHQEYEALCLKADRMLLGVTRGDL